LVSPQWRQAINDKASLLTWFLVLGDIAWWNISERTSVCCVPDQSYSHFSKLKNSTATSIVAVDLKKSGCNFSTDTFSSSLAQLLGAKHKFKSISSFSHVSELQSSFAEKQNFFNWWCQKDKNERCPDSHSKFLFETKSIYYQNSWRALRNRGNIK